VKRINFNRVWATTLRHMMTWPRSLERIADAFWWPSFSLFLWGLVTIFLERQTGMYQLFITLFMGGVIMWLFVYRSQEEMGLMFLQEAWDRNLLNMFSSPLTIWEFTIAAFLLSFIKLMISVAWMTFLAYLLFQFNLFRIGWILIPYAGSLLITGGILGIIINSLIIRYGYRIQVFAWTLVQILQPFSGVFYPLDIMPQWMQLVARVIPTSYIFEGMRRVLQDGFVDYSGLLMATLLNGIYFVFAVWFFLWSYQKAREHGMLMKFS
jgi:ABC-2 type transport system permease protein